MKRLLLLFIALIFVMSLSLSGCSEQDRSGKLREFLSLNEDAFSEVFTEEPCSFSDFSSYMANWANANHIDIVYEGDHSLVMKNSASDGYDDKPSCLLLCSFNTENPSGNKSVIATAQTSLLGPINHGDIFLAVAEKNGDQFTGVGDIPKKYLSCDDLINLSKTSNNNIFTSGPVAAVSTFHRSGKEKKSDYVQAFEIRFSMPEYADPFEFSKGSSYPNPINTVGGFLASARSAGKLFDIASFESKSHDGFTPYFAKAVVVVDANHIESFNSRFESSFENIQEKFEDLEAEFEYTMVETAMPDKVLSDDVSVGLISLMYTLNTGVCQQDEESGVIYAASYIQSVKTEDGDLDITVNMRSRGESYMDSLSAEYDTTAGLCSTEYAFNKTGRLWRAEEGSSLVSYFTGCVPQTGPVESAVSLRATENDFIADRLPKQNMIIYCFDKGDRKTVLDNIINYLDPAIQK